MGSAGSQSSAQNSRAPLTTRLAIIVVRGYQYCISPFIPSRCRFYPTCSHYAIDAVKEYGVIKGSWMTLNRLLRCHPLNEGGFDPVIPKNDRSHKCIASSYKENESKIAQQSTEHKNSTDHCH